MRLISRNPIGVTVKLYYVIIGEENLRKEGLNWINWKILGLVWMVVRSGGTIVQLFPKSKISLTLLIFIL